MGWAEFILQWELQFPSWPAAFTQSLQEVIGTKSQHLPTCNFRWADNSDCADFSGSGFVSAYQFGEFLQGFGPFADAATNVRSNLCISQTSKGQCADTKVGDMALASRLVC